MKQNAMDALAYWVSFTSCFLLVYINIGIFIQPFPADILLATCRIVRTALMNLLEFGHKCQRAVLHSLIHGTVNNSGDIRKCDWLEHLMRGRIWRGNALSWLKNRPELLNVILKQ